MPQKRHAIGTLGVEAISKGGIRVERLEDRVKPRVPFPHRHDFYQILLMKTGAGSHAIDFKTYKVAARQIFCLKPGQVHAWNLSAKAVGLLIEFTPESFLTPSRGLNFGALTDALPDCFRVIKADDYRELWRAANKMASEFKEKNPLFEEALRSSLENLLIHLSRHASIKAAPAPGPSKAQDFTALVDSHYARKHQVSDYAQMLGVSAKALNMQVQRLYGRAPREILHERLLLEARRLLAYSTLNVSEISYEIGYDDPNYFTRFFRQMTGQNPLEFRKKQRTS